MRADYLHQYFSRYLLIREYKENALHIFFLEAARLYPPQSEKRRELTPAQDPFNEADTS